MYIPGLAGCGEQGSEDEDEVRGSERTAPRGEAGKGGWGGGFPILVPNGREPEGRGRGNRYTSTVAPFSEILRPVLMDQLDGRG